MVGSFGGVGVYRWIGIYSAGVLALASALTACSQRRAQVSSGSTRATTTVAPITTTTEPLESISWASVTVPAAVCPGLSHPVTLIPNTGDTGTFGAATFPGPPFAGTPDDEIVEYQTYYGALSPQTKVAALYVWCSNTGGTADGNIQNSLVVYGWVAGSLSVLATLTPQQPNAGGIHAPYFDGTAGGISITSGMITTKELFAGPGDAVCCPSGRATTIWTFDGHTFSPSTTVQVHPTGT